MVWLGWLDLDVALVWRACAGAAGVLAILTVLGYAPSRLLCAGALRPYRWPLAPLLGWIVLTISCYLLMTTVTFGPALAITTALAIAADAAVIFVGQRKCRVSSVEFRVGQPPETRNPKLETKSALVPLGIHRRWPRLGLLPSEAGLPVAIALGSALVFGALLWPHLRQGSLALLVPNQDDEYFVDSVDYMWHTPHGLRLNLGGGRIETGWPYHLLVATFRPFTVVDDYEAMPLAGYVAVALAVAPTTLLFHRELRLPISWALPGAALSLLHGLVLWTPGYGFGPNAAGIAAAPLAFACAGRALRLRSGRALLLGGLALSFLIMSYTKVSIILYATFGLGAGIAFLACSLATRPAHHSSPITPHSRWLWRLPALWLLGAAFGGYAILDLVAWSVQQQGSLLFDREVTTGAGWGWTDFPSLAAWAGTATWSLIGSVLPQSAGPAGALLTWLGTLAAALAMACGLWSLRHPRYRTVWAMLLGWALFYLYARYVKAFPYAVFKLYTLTAFLAVGLTLRGAYVAFATYAAQLRPSSRQAVTPQSKIQNPKSKIRPLPRSGLPTLAPGAAAAGAVLYVFAFAANTGRTLSFYDQPWAPLLTPPALAEARAATAAIPRGSNVLISGTFVVPVAPEQAGVRPHPIGYHTYWEALQAGAQHLRGDARHRLRQAGSAAGGVYTRFAGGTVEPLDQYDYLLLGADEAPEFFGTDESRRVYRGSLLAVYRAAGDNALDAAGVGQLLDQAGAGGPATLSVDCDGHVGVGSRPAALPVTACGRATVTLGLLPTQPGPVSLRVEMPAGEQELPVYVGHGLTWYRTVPLPLPATIAIVPEARGTVYVGSAVAAPVSDAAPPDPSVQHVEGGAAIVNLRVAAEKARLDVRYGNDGALGNVRVALMTEAFGPGKGFPTDAAITPFFQEWRWQIAPGRVPDQQIGGRIIPLNLVGEWPGGDGERWLRVVLQRDGKTWREIPVGRITVRGGQVVAVDPERTLIALPPPDRVTRPPLPDSGTLVKGKGSEVFFVDGKALHWIPTVDVFQRRGFTWQSVQQVDDQVLLRWPLGVPLD